MRVKSKNILLIAVAIVIGFILYSFAIKTTLTLRQESIELKNQLQQDSDAPSKANDLKKKLIEIDKAIGSCQKIHIDIQQALLGIVTDYCQKTNSILREFPKSISTKEKGVLIETNVFVLEGEFTKLLRLIYVLEQKNKLGKIVSVKFRTKKDFQTKNICLISAVYLQNMRKNNAK